MSKIIKIAHRLHNTLITSGLDFDDRQHALKLVAAFARAPSARDAIARNVASADIDQSVATKRARRLIASQDEHEHWNLVPTPPI
jgi:hypothetical protein